jgi:LuxR family maltose regulon positive regulatory protein
LIERLNDGLLHNGCFTRRLTLASAPAGFGKTTTLAEWVRQIGDPAVPDLSIKTAWLSLDAQDNDPTRFWTYFVAALRRADPEIGRDALATLQSSVAASTAGAEPVEVALLLLINQLADSSSAWVMVLDDYHAIASQAIHEALASMLERLPLQMHLVIATRADPSLPIARLRGRGQMLGLYQSDLRFTLGEVAEFLGQVPGLELSDRDVAALEERTEGWIAGLQMAAVSMRGRKDITGFVRAFTGSHRYILDYLGEEVLRQQPEDVRRFL